MMRLLFALILLIAPVLGWAANTSISDGESGLSVRNKLNRQLNQQYNVKQPPYSAYGDCPSPCHDDTTAIQRAITDACNAGGGHVFLPTGAYKVTASLTLCPRVWANVTIQGENQKSTTIQGDFTGYVINKPDDNNYNSIIGIKDIRVINSRKDLDAGAIRLNGIDAGVYVSNCTLSGYTALEMAYNTFTATVNNCSFTPPDNNGVGGTVAMYAAQVSLRDSKITGYDVGIRTRGVGTVINNVAVEGSNTGLEIGKSRPNVFHGTISGTTLTITQWVAGPGITLSPFTLNLSSLNCAPCGAAGNPTITARPAGCSANAGTGCQLTDTYTLSAPVRVGIEQTLLTDSVGDLMHAASIDSFQTERDNIGISAVSFGQVAIRNTAITGSIGVGYQGSSASWSADNGGTFTYHITNPFIPTVSGGSTCYTEGWTPRQYNFTGGHACTVSGTTITMTGVGSDPGSAMGLGMVSPRQTNCMQFGTGSGLLVENLSCGIDARTDLDFGTGTLTDVTLTNVYLNAGTSTVLPLPQSKAGVKIINSHTMPALNMNYADLPGPGTGNSVSTRVDGMEYDIVNGADANCTAGSCTFGANVTGGGGGLHLRVRWNAGTSNWTVMGR